MKFLKVLGFATLIAASGTAASQAAVIYATSVDSYTQGTGITQASRLVQSKALGQADGKFLSLGLGGEAIFSFGQLFRAPGAISEITNGARAGYLEGVKVYGGLGGVFALLGTVTNGAFVNSFNFAGTFDQLKLVDVSPNGIRRDGYDIDAISVSAIPLPAAGVMLLSALGLVSVARRRKA